MSSRVPVISAALSLSLSLFTGCAQPMPGDTLMGTVARNMEPSTSDLGTLYAENTGFSLELLDTVYTAAPGNTLLSPWSLQVVLAQVYAGGDSAVQAAIADTSGWSLSGDALHEAFDAADLSVVSHDDPAADLPVTLTSTNQVFSDLNYDIGADWLNTLSEYYGTGVQQMNLSGDSANSARAINAWVEDRTGGHIKDLVDAESVAASRLLLVNAVYFNASWPVEFSEGRTAPGPFTLLDGSTVDVPTMSGSVAAYSATGDGFFVADLPYSDRSLTLTIVVPDAGRFAEVLGGLDTATLDTVVAAETGSDSCEVNLPSFEVSSKPDLNAALQSMGLGPAYGGAYPGINDELTVQSIRQQGFVSVNETGTEAAAATVVEMGLGSEPPPCEPIVIDRPFFYLIREVGGAVLFTGVVTDPR